MFFFKRKPDTSHHTSNNVIVPMDSDRLRRISEMSVEDARKTYDRIIELSNREYERREA